MRLPGSLLLVALLLTAGCVTDLTGSGEGVETPGVTTEPTPTPAPTPAPGRTGDSGIQSTYVELYQDTVPSVVSVTVFSAGDTSMAESSGTGFVYDEDGHIVTNQHVVDAGDDVEVTFQDGETVPAETIGTSIYNDLAVLRVDPEGHELEPLELGDSSRLREGHIVLALGNPLGFEGSMTHGIVSALGRTMPVQGGFGIPGVIQTDAPINPGNSGGPLINLAGEVVGVNRAKAQAENIGFAISSNLVERVVPALIEDGNYRDPWIGIRTQDVRPAIAEEMGLREARGVEVVEVVPNSPADRAGLRGATGSIEVHGIEYDIGGDVIVGIDGRPIRVIDDVLSYLSLHASVGDTVDLHVIRDGREVTVDLTLGERPPPRTQ